MGYGTAMSGGASFVGPLDALVAQGAGILGAYSVRRLLGSYTGKACRLRANGAGAPEADIGYVANGDLDSAAIASLIAGSAGATKGFWRTFYTQYGAINLTQASAAAQPPFTSDYQSKGALGGDGLGTDTYMNFNAGTPSLPFALMFVVSFYSTGTACQILGTTATLANRFIEAGGSGEASHNYGATASSSGTAIPDAAASILSLSNGASSKLYVNGTVVTSGTTGGTQLNLSGARIGAGFNTSTGFFGQDDTISEVIAFSTNPTGLAGWSAFCTAQNTYFGITP